MASKLPTTALRILSGAMLLAGIYAPILGREASVDYTQDIQPILNAHCSPCHTGSQSAGGLSLVSFAAVAKGGVSGTSIVAKNPDKSLLLSRILGKGGLPRMPMGFKPLSDSDTALIRTWIQQGALRPDGNAKKVHWAFKKPVISPLPVVLDKAWSRNALDLFVLSRLEKEGLRPSPEADKVTLIRRLTLDLTGLPPSPAQVDAFVADKSPGAYEKVVDRLFANPHYGERMALPWLDAARYADSNGFQTDGDTFQYVWRDWVVKALNANMPFDQFTMEQIAGDLLPNPSLDQLVATAFNRNHMLNGEGGAIPEEQRNVTLFDRVDTTSTTWLGLTMTCARCHDHKYDPISQRDYFSLMAFFNNVPETGVPEGGVPYSIASPWIYAGDASQMRELKNLEASLPRVIEKSKFYETEFARRTWEIQAQKNPVNPQNEEENAILAILKTPEASRAKESVAKLQNYFLDHGLTGVGKELRSERKALEAKLASVRASLPRVMVMSDQRPRVTHVLNRGNYEEPTDVVEPETPAYLPKLPPKKKNRLDLAKWIISPENPLTARVQVNRQWQMFFGRGLVRTEENFGIKGVPPTHPELLDYLAVTFRESGWNVKKLQKMIVMSSTYRQSSKVSPLLLSKDPENRLLARAPRFRMSSLLLRDVALASSGLLNAKMGGKPVYPYQPKGIWDGLAITDARDFSYPQSKGTDNHRRSIYTFWRRTAAPGNMFDAASRQICTVKSSLTSTPLHSLTMLNDVTWVEASRGLAATVLPLASDEARLKEAYRRVCARRPNDGELKILLKSLARSREAFRLDASSVKLFLSQGESPVDPKLKPAELAAFTSVCLAIYNLDEAMTRE